MDPKDIIQNPVHRIVDIFNHRNKKLDPEHYAEIKPSSGLLEEFVIYMKTS